MFHQVFVGDSISPDMEPEEPMETSHLEPANLCPDQAPSIQDYLNADVKLNTSFVNLTDVISHMMDDKSLIKDLEENFLKDSAVVIKKEPEEEDSDLCGTNVTYELVGRVKPETSTSSVKTETYVKEELHSSAEDMPDSSLALESLVLPRGTRFCKIDPFSPAVNFPQEIDDPDKKIGLKLDSIGYKSELVKPVKVEQGNKDTSETNQEEMSCSTQSSGNDDQAVLSAQRQPEHVSEHEKIFLRTRRNNTDNKESENVSVEENSDTGAADFGGDSFDEGSDWEREYINSQKHVKNPRKKKMCRNTSASNGTNSSVVKTNTAECNNSQNSSQIQQHTNSDSDKVNNKKGDFKFLFFRVLNDDEIEKPIIKPKPYKRVYKKSYMCDICGKRFRNNTQLENHTNMHNNVRPYKCSTCGNTFTSQYLLDSHNKTVHLKLRKRFLCSKCTETFEYESDLKAHEANHSVPEGSEVPKPFKCPKCDKTFETKYKRSKHSYYHIKGKRCLVCREIFGSAAPMRYHMEDVHGIKREYKCPICDKVFACRKSLAQHRKITHSTVLKFFCDICGKGFKQKHHIEQHMITHSDERPISCSQCDETFKRPTHLKQHVAAFHQNKKR